MARWPWQRKQQAPKEPSSAPWQHLQSIQEIQAGKDQIEPPPLTQLTQEHAQLFPKPSPLHRHDIPPAPSQVPKPVHKTQLLLQQLTRTVVAFWRGTKK